MFALLPGKVSGTSVVSSQMAEEDFEKVAPTIANLNMISGIIADNIEASLEDAKNASLAIRKILKDDLGADIILRGD